MNITMGKVQAPCDTCGEEEARIAEDTELFCGRCYVNKLKQEGVIIDG